MDGFDWMDAPSFDDELLKTLEQLKQKENAAYDGVLGTPPKWVPEWHMNKFQISRNRLLDANKLSQNGFTSAQIIEWLNRQKRNIQAISLATNGEYIRTEYVPIEFIEDTNCLK